MLLKIVGFDGLQPAVDPRLLPDNKATTALDTRLVNGSLRAWKEPKFIITLEKVGDIEAIYRFGQNITNEDSYWFHWLTDVDVVRGPVPDEATERTYWTGDPPYPKYTYTPLATTGGTNYPEGSHRLGVPAPTPAPSVAAGTLPPQDAVETSRPVDIVSIEADGATTARVTLAEATTFDTNEPTKVVVAGATPVQYNGIYDVTWESPTVFTYVVSTPSNPATSQETKTVSVSAISRVDANTAQVALTDETDFITTEPTKITVSGCNVAEFNGTFDADWQTAQVIQYSPVRPNQTVNLTQGPTDPDFYLGRYDAFTGIVNLYNTTKFDQSSSIRVTIQNVVTPTVLNGTFDGTWIDASTIHFTTIVEIPDVAIVGPDNAPWITTTLQGNVVVDIPTSPSPTVSTVTLKGVVSNELPTGSSVTGVEQVYLSGMATPTDERTREARNYVVTFVTPLGEEGPPSVPTAIVEVVSGQEVTLDSLPLPPSGEGWNLPAGAKKRLYRSATSGTAAVYVYVTELDIAVTSYTDTLTSEELAEALESQYWTPPPTDLKGLCLLANGSLAGFRNNEVWFSEPQLPHAWPSRNMTALDAEVVGIGAFGNSLFVGTKGTPYIFSGTDPSQMYPTRVPVEQSCVSKRSVVEVAGGVIYASPDGLCLADGNGVQVLTEKLMNRDDWQAYNPSSIRAASHDFRYYGFFTRADNSTGTVVLDMSGAGAALWEMDAHYLAAFNDVNRDGLYVVDASRLLWRMHEGDSLVPYVWKSKVFDVPLPTNFGAAQVVADSYPLTFRVWSGDTLDAVNADTPFTVTVTSAEPFRLPAGFRHRFWKFGLEGTSVVFSAYVAHSVSEMAGA